MSELLHISIRSLAPAALAALCLWRVQSAALKHAVWTVVTAGMLLQLLASPLLPPLDLPVLRPIPQTPATAPVATVGSISYTPAQREFPGIPVLYFLGLAFFAARLLRALLFTRGLIRRAHPIAPGRHQSDEIAVPMTTGLKILLPSSWAEWDPATLSAVLAHEQAHIRRRDPLIALLARINRCVFWFHPLAWWLERHLAQLAEQACDDAALASVPDRRTYARTLLDMARAVHSSQGRFLTASMAKESNMESRINRVLDETRRIPRALGRTAWTALAACAAPLLYLAAVVRLVPAPALAQIPASAPPAPPEPVQVTAPPPPDAPAPRPTSPPYAYSGPRVYNGQNKTFYFFQAPAPEFGNLPKPANPAFTPNAGTPVPEGPPLSVSFSPLRSGTITIPLDGEGEHQVNVRLTTPDGHFVTSADHLVTGASWSLPISLRPGKYHVEVRVRTDGKAVHSTLNFEVE